MPIAPEQILHALPHSLIVTDPQGTIVFANSTSEKFFGVDPNEMVGSHIALFFPGIGPRVMEALQEGKSLLGYPFAGSGTNLVLNITLISEKNQVSGAVCTFEEMGHQEAVAHTLDSYRDLNRQLKAIFESSSDGIWVCDGHGQVININEASEKLNGIKAETVIGKNVKDLLSNGLFDRSVTLEVLQTRRQVSIVQNIRKTGKILLATGTPVLDETGRIYLVVVNERDMTQLNTIREQLEQSRLVTEKYREELAELSLLELKNQEIIAESIKMQQVLRVALKLAHLEASNILILGESGTGKGLLAKFIHKNSRRSNKPFIQINCAALPENLLEAELFGYERGAFTGAREQGKIGLFELAQGGTLFLDEIGDLPFSVQAKLLKYLDDHEIMRLGALKPRKIECTIIAATNRDLEDLTRRHQFRQDLFYRLNTFTIHIPPLRERPEDIFELISHFLDKYNKTYQVKRRISPDALRGLQSHSFPGNVRELKNLLKQAVLMSDDDMIDELPIGRFVPDAVPGLPEPAKTIGKPSSFPVEVSSLEKQILERALKNCRTTRELARHLGISQPTVVRKLKKHRLSTPHKRKDNREFM